MQTGKPKIIKKRELVAIEDDSTTRAETSRKHLRDSERRTEINLLKALVYRYPVQARKFVHRQWRKQNEG